MCFRSNCFRPLRRARTEMIFILHMLNLLYAKVFAFYITMIMTKISSVTLRNFDHMIITKLTKRKTCNVHLFYMTLQAKMLLQSMAIK